jgi:hypothetical protein
MRRDSARFFGPYVEREIAHPTAIFARTSQPGEHFPVPTDVGKVGGGLPLRSVPEGDERGHQGSNILSQVHRRLGPKVGKALPASRKRHFLQAFAVGSHGCGVILSRPGFGEIFGRPTAAMHFCKIVLPKLDKNRFSPCKRRPWQSPTQSDAAS